MGGGDLNLKKSWHPSTFANLKKLYEAEQAHSREEQKLDQLRKEKAAEREVEEMRKLQEGAGLIAKRSERVEWMYSGSSVGATSITEEFLLGKRRFDQIPHGSFDSKDVRTVPAQSSIATSALMQNGSLREAEAKLREDPLFVIKKREKEVIDAIIHNPVKKAQYQLGEPAATGLERRQLAVTKSGHRETFLRHQSNRHKIRESKQNFYKSQLSPQRTRSRSPESRQRSRYK